MATQTNIQYSCLQTYFSKANKFTVKCNICNKLSSNSHALRHLHKFHNIIDQEAISNWNDDNHSIWKYFSKKELFTAECKHCGNLFNAYSKNNLQKHLMSLMHLQLIAPIRDEITRTWVSQHVTFNVDNCDKYCRHCNCSFKIYDGVDVLKNHLINRHHINEDLEFHGKTENYNVDATTQESITEGNNVATSSQDHNVGVNRSGIQDPQR